MVYYRVYTVDVALDYELCDNNSSKVFRLRKVKFLLNASESSYFIYLIRI